MAFVDKESANGDVQRSQVESESRMMRDDVLDTTVVYVRPEEVTQRPNTEHSSHVENETLMLTEGKEDGDNDMSSISSEMLTRLACLSSQNDDGTNIQHSVDNPDVSDRLQSSSDCSINSTGTVVLRDAQASLAASVYGCDKTYSTLTNVDLSGLASDAGEDAVCSTNSTSVLCDAEAASAASAYRSDKTLSLLNTYELPATCPNAGVVSENNLSQPLGESNVSQPVQVHSKQKPKSGHKKNCDKRHFCVFCKTQVTCKISRHLLRVHKDDARVAEISKMEKLSRQRRHALNLLANEGNLQHNVAVLKKGAGKLVVSHRTPSNHQSSDYAPCAECHKFVLRKRLWHHYKTCMSRNAECPNITEPNKKVSEEGRFGENLSKKLHAVAQSRALLSGMLCGENEKNLQDVLARMRDDDVKEIVQGDALIRRCACIRAESLGPKDSRKISDIHRVSQSARTLARLVAVCRQEIPEADLYSLLRPEHMDLLVESAKKLSCSDGKPSATLNKIIFHTLVHAVPIKIAECIKTGDDAEADKTRQFEQVFQSAWNDRVNDTLEKMRNQKSRKLIPTVPVTEDLVKLRSCILLEVTKVVNKLEQEKEQSDWTLLAKLIMARLLLFNKCHRSHLQDMKVKDYVDRQLQQSCEDGGVQSTVLQTDAILANRFESYVTYVVLSLRTDLFLNLL